MASPFERAFNPAFQQAMSQTMRKMESEQADARMRQRDEEAEARLNARMESNRAYDKKQLDELRAFQAAKDESDYQKSLARNETERTRADSEKTFKLMANAPSGIAFDATTDPEEQVRKHNLFLDLQKRQAMAGMPVSKLKTANIGQPELPESFDPGDVTPEMEGELAEFIRGKGIRLGEEAFNRTQAQSDKQIGIRAEADYNALSFSQKEVFRRQLGADSGKPFNFSDNPYGGAAKVISARLEEGRQYEKKSDEAKRDIDYINKNAIYIPIGSSYKPDYDADGNPTQVSMAEFRMRNKEVIDPVSRLTSRQWFSGSLDPQPMPGVPGVAAPGAAPGVPAANPFRAGGLSGRSETSTEGTGEAAGDGATPFPAPISGPIPMPGTFPPLESDSKEREFWEGLGASRQTYEAARNAYNFDVGAGPFGREGRYSLPGPRPGSRGRVILPLIRGMGDINPKEESLFDAAMSRLSAQDAFLTKRIDPIDRRIQEIKGTGASPTYSKSLVLRQELARLLKDREPLSEKLSKVEELRNDLVWSFR